MPIVNVITTLRKKPTAYIFIYIFFNINNSSLIRTSHDQNPSDTTKLNSIWFEDFHFEFRYRTCFTMHLKMPLHGETCHIAKHKNENLQT